MSFGWSAGDILAAVQFIGKVVKALNDVEGSPKNFARTANYLRPVEISLNQLYQAVKEEESKETIWEAPDVKALNAVINGLKPLVEELAAKVAQYYKLPMTGKSIKNTKQWSFQQVNKLRWKFFEQDDVDKLMDAIHRQIGSMGGMYHARTLKAVETQNVVAAIYHDDVLSHLVDIKALLAIATRDNQFSHLGPEEPKALAPFNTLASQPNSTTAPATNVAGVAPNTSSQTAANLAPNAAVLPNSATSSDAAEIFKTLSPLAEFSPSTMKAATAAKYNHLMADAVLVGKIKTWLSGKTPSRLWLYGKDYTAISTILYSVALKRCRRVISFSCQHIIGGQQITHEERVIQMTYSFLFQLLQQIPSETIITDTQLKASLPRLDGSMASLPVALRFMQYMLQLLPQVVVIIQGFQWLSDSSNPAINKYLVNLLRLFEKNTAIDELGDVPMNPRILMVTAGRADLLISLDTQYLNSSAITTHLGKGQRLSLALLDLEW